jgi:hypothetical protein
MRPAFALAVLVAALGGCGSDALSVKQSGSGDLFLARQGRALLVCVAAPDSLAPCTRATAAVVVPDAPTGYEADAYWENDSLVQVMAFGGDEIRCTPTALDGRVAVRLRRLPRERLRRNGFESRGGKMFEQVPDSCGGASPPR